MATQATSQTATEQAEALAGRVFGSTLGAIDIATMYLGERLGLYRALAEKGPLTSGKLAKAAGIHERYAREWLEQQAVTEIIKVDDTSLDADDRQYSLPEGHRVALLEPESPYSATPLVRALVSIVQTLPKVLVAFRSGGGVPWADFGIDGIEAQGDFNRPWIVGQLGSDFLPSIPDLHQRLQSASARVAEVACGLGWAGISIAKAYPNVKVDGFDLDEASVHMANRAASEAGVGDRVRFTSQDSTKPGPLGHYDLVLMIEALHDLPRPVETLTAMRAMMSPGGAVIVADERTADAFTVPADDFERFLYGASVTLCLPASMSEQPSAATGTVIREGTVRSYALQAGFKAVEVLEQIEHPMLKFYRLVP